MTLTQRKKLVVAHSTREGAPLHEVETNRALERWLAQILGLKFGGSYDLGCVCLIFDLWTTAACWCTPKPITPCTRVRRLPGSV